MAEFQESYFQDEIREGFKIDGIMKRAWAAQIEVLEIIDHICRKYGLMYYADWGTLLGTVRHEGFIPWDDDIDIAMKRQDYVSWDAYFMGVALLSAQRSKDNNTQVGSCIVNPHNKILSMGYNGMPTGCNDDRMPWERKGTPLDTKYLYVCHAELNAILNYSGGSLRGARIYTTLFPCNECTKAIIQAGITEVIYYSDKYADTDSTIAAKLTDSTRKKARN